MKHCTLLTVAALFIAVRPAEAAEPAYNYTEALQKSIYFYECQRSGKLAKSYTVTAPWQVAIGQAATIGSFCRSPLSFYTTRR